jgi:two-component system sensor histidine kinase KdpD
VIVQSTPSIRRWAGPLGRAAASLGAVVLVTGGIFALRPVAPVLSLGVLYLFAVLPVAALWGLPLALAVSVVSMLTFNWFLLPPTHTFRLADSENWVALAVYLVTAVSVSELAASARRRAAEAEQLLASLRATVSERERLERDARESEARRRGEAIEAEALRRSDAVKTAVLRSVSHDLRSPITAIMTASEVLQDAGGRLSAAERNELLGSIRLQVRRLERFFSNLLELSRLEAGAAQPVPELWTMDGLLARALEAVGPAGERVVVALSPDTPPVRVDPAQLEHVLVNLLENALKFSGPDDPVEVYVDQVEDAVVARVCDHGSGIPPEERERVFEPFARGARGEGERGSGLGLAIARGFVQENGGRLWIESRAGRGAELVLSFPAVRTLERAAQ